MSGVKFVDELPVSVRITKNQAAARWAELDEHPGQWAEWWTDNPKSAYTSCWSKSRNGHKYEAAMRGGKAYVRAVKSSD